MKFGKILLLATSFSGALVSAVPTANEDTIQVVTRDAPGFNFPLAVRTIKELNSKAESPEGLDKRDDEYINSLLELLHNSNLLDLFVGHLANNSNLAGTVSHAVTKAISSNLVNPSVLMSAITRSGSLSNVFNSMLDNRDLSPSVLEHTRDLFSAGLVDLDGTVESKRDNVIVDELSDISKRDVADFIVEIVNAISNSGLVAKILNSVLTNPAFLKATESLIVGVIKDVDWSAVIKSVWNSGIIQDVFKGITSRITSSAKRDALSPENEQLLSSLSSVLRLKMRDGVIKREEITGETNLASLAKAALGTAASTSTTTATSKSTTAPVSTATAATTTKSTAKTTTSGNAVANLINEIFGGNNKTSTTSTKAATTSTKATSSSTSTHTGLIEGLIDDIFKHSKTTTSTKAATSTKTSTKASSTHTGLIEELIDDIFGHKNSTKTTTTTTHKATSTGSILLEIFDDIFHPTNATATHTATSGGDLLEDVLVIAEKGVAALFKGGKNSTGSRIIHAGLDFAGGLVEDLFGRFFHHNSTSTSSSGNGKSLLTEIFDDLFNERTLRFLLRVVEWIFDFFFGHKSSSSSSGGSGAATSSGVSSTPTTTTVAKTTTLAKTTLATTTVAKGTPATTTIGKTTSATTTLAATTAAAEDEEEEEEEEGDSCSQATKVKRSPVDRLKRRIKREITRVFIERASAGDAEKELNQLGKLLI